MERHLEIWGIHEGGARVSKHVYLKQRRRSNPCISSVAWWMCIRREGNLWERGRCECHSLKLDHRRLQCCYGYSIQCGYASSISRTTSNRGSLPWSASYHWFLAHKSYGVLMTCRFMQGRGCFSTWWFLLYATRRICCSEHKIIHYSRWDHEYPRIWD